MTTLLTFGLGQGIMLAAMLFFRSFRQKGHSWLVGLFVLSVSGFVSAPLLNGWLGGPYGSFAVDPLAFLIGPSLFAYISSLSRPGRIARFWPHLAVFVAYIPVLYVFAASAAERGFHKEIYSSVFAVSLGVAKFTHLLAYAVLCFFEVHVHRQRAERAFSNLKGRDLRWLQRALVWFLALSLASFALYLVAVRFPGLQEAATSANLLAISAFLFFLSFHAFQQPNIFDGQLPGQEAISATPETAGGGQGGPRYEKSGLRPEDAASINSAVDRFLENGGHLDPDLTLAGLAKAVGEPPHRVSEALGKYRGETFYDLVNRHRVMAVKSALTDPASAHLSILGIAFQNGYNSKSAFNAAFKKFTGQTPSEYKKHN